MVLISDFISIMSILSFIACEYFIKILFKVFVIFYKFSAYSNISFDKIKTLGYSFTSISDSSLRKCPSEWTKSEANEILLNEPNIRIVRVSGQFTFFAKLIFCVFFSYIATTPLNTISIGVETVPNTR